MFTHYQIIDTVQSGKKQFVNTFVTDTKFKDELNKLIDAQTEFAKGSVDSSLAIARALYGKATETMKTMVPSFTK